ncbi:MAG: HlyD family secretion protein, partial [Sphingobacterium sp.]
MIRKNYLDGDIHSEDLQEIISKPPSWLLKRGISFVLLTVLIIFGLSALIRYPEILTNSMRITTDNAPKVVTNKIEGKLVKIVVNEGEEVEIGQILGYMESTADHDQVLKLLELLTSIRIEGNIDSEKLRELTSPTNIQLGELQAAYQNFYEAFLSYVSVKEGGISLKRRNILEQEMDNIRQQRRRAEEAHQLQTTAVELAKQEFDKYKILAARNVISPMELQKQEALLLTKLQGLPQSESIILNNQAASLARSKELAELDNQIEEVKMKFIQSMNSLISETEIWKQQYILTSSSRGRVIYGSVLQEGQHLTQTTEVFYVYSQNSSYFGEMYLPQRDFGKIQIDQEVLIKLRSYPYEEYGFLRGKI